HLSNSKESILTNNMVIYNTWAAISLRRSGNSTLTNNTIINNARKGISLGNSGNSTLENNTITNNLHGFYLYNSSNSILTNNMIINNQDSGMTIVIEASVSEYCIPNIRIADNIFINCSLGIYRTYDYFTHGYYWGPKPEDFYHVEVLNNTINGKLLLVWLNKTGEIVPSGVGQIILVNCRSITVTGLDLFKLEGYNSSNLYIYDNTLSGIYIEGDNNNVSHNELYNDGSIYIWGNNSIISHNELSNGGGIGNNGANNILSYNDLSNGGDIDIHGENITLSNNIVSDSELYAISTYLVNSTITNNIINNSGWSGIFVKSCENTVISSNIVTNSGWYGIAVHNSANCSVVGNTVRDSKWSGIHVWYSNNTRIYFNNFYDNNVAFLDGITQANDNFGAHNSFAYNYWNDLTGPDANSDGIVDKSYSIDGTKGNRDYYPLVAPNPLQKHLLVPPSLIYPNGNENINNTVTIYWISAMDSFNHPITYSVYYSPDDGNNWELLAANLVSTSLVWDTSSLPSGTDYLVKVVAQCSEGLTAEDISYRTFRILNFPTTSSTSSSTSDYSTFGFTLISIFAILPVIIQKKLNQRKSQ
ncbi:MAG: right-handed parallel beta-helix repeat-containing protein, partial [Candidatus Hodarchaeota archaeon]